MAEIPKTLQGFTAIVDGEGYVGKITRGTPPTLAKSLLEHRAGMMAPIDLFRGFEKMECQFSIREFNAAIARQMVVYDMSGEGSLIVRMVGAELSPTGEATPVDWEIGGQFSQVEPGEIDAADPQTEMTLMCTCARVKLTIAQDVIWDIDIPKSEAIINGTDVWAGVKAILEQSSG